MSDQVVEAGTATAAVVERMLVLLQMGMEMGMLLMRVWMWVRVLPRDVVHVSVKKMM